MIDAKLSSKRKTPAAEKVKVQTSGRDKNEYVEKPSCRQRDPVNIITTGRGRESGSAQHSRR